MLLYTMIPKEVADRLRYGTDSSVDTCQVKIFVVFIQELVLNQMCLHSTDENWHICNMNNTLNYHTIFD